VPHRCVTILCVCAAFLLALPPLAAQPPGGGEPSTRPAQGRRAERSKPLLVSAQEVHANEKGPDIWELIGNVEMVQKNPDEDEKDATHIYAQYCLWNRKENTAVITKGVKIVDPTNEIHADRCDIDFDEDTAVFTQNVKVFSQNKDKPADYKPNADTDPYEYGKWTTTCDKIEYNYDKDTGVASGNIKSISEDGEYTVTADVAYYELRDDDNEVITIPNNPRVVTPEQEWFTCEKVIITVPPEDGKSKVDLWNLRGLVKPDEEKKTKPEGTPPASGPTPTVPPSGGPPGTGFEGGAGGPGGGTGTGGSGEAPPSGGSEQPPGGGTGGSEQPPGGGSGGSGTRGGSGGQGQ